MGTDTPTPEPDAIVAATPSRILYDSVYEAGWEAGYRAGFSAGCEAGRRAEAGDAYRRGYIDGWNKHCDHRGEKEKLKPEPGFS